jgi:hypothetical protein
MALDELHGFLAAVICSPQMIMPSAWIAHVWGGEEPAFANMEQAQDVMGMMMRLHNDVAARLADEDFDPLFMEETLANGDVALAPHAWCHGFVRVVQLQPEGWQDAPAKLLLHAVRDFSDCVGCPIRWPVVPLRRLGRSPAADSEPPHRNGANVSPRSLARPLGTTGGVHRTSMSRYGAAGTAADASRGVGGGSGGGPRLLSPA